MTAMVAALQGRSRKRPLSVPAGPMTTLAKENTRRKEGQAGAFAKELPMSRYALTTD